MKLHGLLITKDDDLLVEDWFAEHHGVFDTIVVVDGSTSSLTKNTASKYSHVSYLRDPACHITAQPLRHHGWVELAKHAKVGDWIFLCHVDEFYYHNPREFMSCGVNLIMWMPLVVLPHPQEAEAWIRSDSKKPRGLFKHYWWRTTRPPHLEHRMWKYVKEPFWNLEIKEPGCGVIPYNYGDQSVWPFAPMYLHYKCVDLNLAAYRPDGAFAKSSLNTGLLRPVSGFDDLFFFEKKPFGDGYFAFDNDLRNAAVRFGNPPRIALDLQGSPVVLNDLGKPVHSY